MTIIPALTPSRRYLARINAADQPTMFRMVPVGARRGFISRPRLDQLPFRSYHK
jgi:hypothetical protein